MTLKIQGQGHNSRSHSRSNILPAQIPSSLIMYQLWWLCIYSGGQTDYNVKFGLSSYISPQRSRSINTKYNKDLNQGVLLLLFKFVGSRLNGWWVIVQMSSRLTLAHTDTQTHTDYDNTQRPKLASGERTYTSGSKLLTCVADMHLFQTDGALVCSTSLMALLIRSVGGLSKCFYQGLWLADLNADVIGQSINRCGVV